MRILQMATWKGFSRFYFHTTLYSSYGMYPDKEKFEDKNFADSKKSTKFCHLKITTYLYGTYITQGASLTFFNVSGYLGPFLDALQMEDVITR